MAKLKTAEWSPEARTDLLNISECYEQVAGPQTAENIVREIAVTVAQIEAHAYSGRSRDEIREGLRSLPAHPHVVFYRVQNDVMQIVRVLDARRDIDSALNESDEEQLAA